MFRQIVLDNLFCFSSIFVPESPQVFMMEFTSPFTQSFPLADQLREKALQWATAFPYCTYLTSNNIPYPEGPFPEVLAVSTREAWNLGNHPFDPLFRLHQKNRNWLFGYFTYDLKNGFHGLSTKIPPTVHFPPCLFFEPECLLFFKEQELEIQSRNQAPDEIYARIVRTQPLPPIEIRDKINLHTHTSREEYLHKVEAIRQHILDGDCYELNLCQEFSASGINVNPLSLFLQLNKRSPSPFAAFLRVQNQYLLCASPERFIKKQRNRLVSQPIKGTIRRGRTAIEDETLKQQLRQDEKEVAENMMIVDLVRNDLARSAQPGSVKVEEMFGIYSFRQVHQMISTVSASLRKEVPFTDAIKNAFPMGSMTGAPKRKVLELIEQYENSARGLYSGSVGFITPDGDFDFNVVIRSILYDQQKATVSFQVGGAITYDSVPEKEYEECLLKAQAILETLKTSINSTPS